MKFTKADLQRKTKAELTAVAKSKFKLKIAASATKDQLVAALQRAQIAAEKKTAKKKTTVKKSASTKATTKRVAGEAGGARKADKTKKTTVKPAKKTPQTSKEDTGSAPIVAPIDATIPEDRPLHRPELPGDVIVTESKYHVAEVSREPDFFDGLQDSYEDNRVILFVRDPFCIFAAWDLENRLPARTAERHGINLDRGRIVLRVYDVTGINFDGNNAHSYFEFESNSVKGNWYIETPSDGASYIVDIGLRDEFGNFFMMARSNAVTTPRASASNRFDEEWMIADDDFWEIYGLSGGFKPGGSSENLAGQMSRHLMHAVSSGGFSGGSESLVRKREEDDFPFELNCELIVYGRTRPDAKVTLKGREIKLNEDGTFNQRYILPDGIQVIDASARSADSLREITITPTISRSTASLNTGSEGVK